MWHRVSGGFDYKIVLALKHNLFQYFWHGFVILIIPLTLVCCTSNCAFHWYLNLMLYLCLADWMNEPMNSVVGWLVEWVAELILDSRKVTRAVYSLSWDVTSISPLSRCIISLCWSVEQVRITVVGLDANGRWLHTPR